MSISLAIHLQLSRSLSILISVASAAEVDITVMGPSAASSTEIGVPAGKSAFRPSMLSVAAARYR